MIISVIVPVYNSEKYLSACIGSIVGQSYTSLEILLIDDGSTDKSGAICDSYAEKDNRIQVFHVKNAGQAAARNFGIEIAKGELLAFVDSDDILDKSMYEKLVRLCFQNHSMFMMCGCYRFSQKGKTSEENFITTEFKSGEEVFSGLILPMLYPGYNEAFIIPSVWRGLYAKEILLKNGISFPNEKKCLGEDLIFNMRYLMCIDKAKILNESLYGYRVNEFSFTNNHSFNPLRLPSIFNMADEIKDILEQKSLYTPEVEQRLLARILDNISFAVKLLVAVNGFKEVRLQMKAARENAYVARAFKAVDISSFGFSLKLFCILFKAKLYLPLYVLIKAFCSLTDRRALASL